MITSMHWWCGAFGGFHWHFLGHMLYQGIYMLYSIRYNESFTKGQHCKRYIFIVFIIVDNGCFRHALVIIFSLIFILFLDAWYFTICIGVCTFHNARLGVICGDRGKIERNNILMRTLRPSNPDLVTRGVF